MLYWMPGEVHVGDIRTPLGKARMVTPGTDCTIVAYGDALYTVMKALAPLDEQGLSCEVIDLRSLVPLNKACILDLVLLRRPWLITLEVALQGAMKPNCSVLKKPVLFWHILKFSWPLLLEQDSKGE